MSVLTRRLGSWLNRTLKINPWLFQALKIEIYAALVRWRGRWDPRWRRRRRDLEQQKGVLANIGCGPTGRTGWVNLDLFQSPGVTLRVDCRRRFPLGDGSCRGIHVEHYFEHLHPWAEKPNFLAECHRVLMPGGILRIIVPDARKYIEAYLADGWQLLNQVGCGEELPEKDFATKIEALNHVFQQDEHYGGIDQDYLSRLLRQAGFSDIEVVAFGKGRFPEGCIDTPQHRTYSLYMEARR